MFACRANLNCDVISNLEWVIIKIYKTFLIFIFYFTLFLFLLFFYYIYFMFYVSLFYYIFLPLPKGVFFFCWIGLYSFCSANDACKRGHSKGWLLNRTVYNNLIFHLWYVDGVRTVHEIRSLVILVEHYYRHRNLHRLWREKVEKNVDDGSVTKHTHYHNISTKIALSLMSWHGVTFCIKLRIYMNSPLPAILCDCIRHGGPPSMDHPFPVKEENKQTYFITNKNWYVPHESQK
jgi:hypothetical protein